MQITKNFLTPNPYSRPQIQLKKVTGIVVHYVGNPGSSAMANRNYFENLRTTKITYASSHYIIGLNGEIIQCIPEDEIAYCSNSANSYTLSIECCHPDGSGKFNAMTYNSLVELCVDICKRYKLTPKTDIIRHYDVTGKACPLYYVRNPSDWTAFKNTVYEVMLAPPPKPPTLAEQLSRHVQIDPPYWDRVLAGAQAASPDYLKVLFERFLAAMTNKEA